MSPGERVRSDPGLALLELYDDALPQVYGYLLARCRAVAIAEDLTSEVFMAAVQACRRQPRPEPSVGWLIGIARHKLVDRWRAAEREQRGLRAVAREAEMTDPWDVELDALLARDVLARQSASHRVVLTLRYLDGLAVPEVASVIGRTVHATEALLVRARAAFRRDYQEGVGAVTDPLDALREPPRPVDPDPTFAAGLRERLERAVLGPAGPPSEDREQAMLEVAETPPHTLTPYLAVVDARAAIEFYVAAFDAVPRGEPVVMPDGRVGHAELAIGDSVLMMADEYPELGLLAPVSRGGPTQTLHLDVTDPDGVVAGAVRLGATLERPVTDQEYGRSGVISDASGHRWMVTRSLPSARAGDVAYASLWVRDDAAARRFYPAVLGFEPALHGGHDHPTLLLCYSVPDLDAAVERVRAAGGTATDPRDRPYGLVADAVDDQGLPFALHQGGPASGPLPAAARLRHPDTTRTRAFYGTVLGWAFHPAAEPGGWRAVRADRGDPRPPVLLAAGSGPAVAVPVFAVDDLDAAVAATRDAGGIATRTTPTTADCADDQGTPFTLNQR